MPSTFFGLDIAYTGVQAANAKVNTTANNIANVDTKGYSRQEANQVASQALRISQSYGMAGTGVTTTDITQVRNEYYDVKYWQSQTNLGQYESKLYYMYQIEDYFTDKDNIEGFEPLFSNMFNTLEEVYKQAGTNSTKTQFLGAAGDLCEYFNGMATNLQKLQLSVNEEIRNKVDEINSIAEQISTLNKQINTIEVNKVHANELRDKRNLLVDQLSKIVDVEIKETPIYTTPGGTQKSGIFTYEVNIAGGQNLVQGYEYNTLQYTARQMDESVNQSDAVGLFDIKWSNGLDFNLYGKNLGGELKGLIEVRDGNNGEYFNGTTKEITKNADGTYEVKIEVPNKEYLLDMNKNTLAPEGQLTLVNTDYKYTKWSFDGSGAKGVYTFTIERKPDQADPAIKELFEGKECRVGDNIDYQGIPYYQEQMNEWVRILAKAMNNIEKEAVDAEGNKAEALLVAKDAVSGNEFKFNHSNTYDTDKTYSSTSDDYYKLTALNFQVNSKMIKNIDYFGTTVDIKKGGDAQDITEQLLTVANDKTKAQFRGCSAKDFLQCIISDVALSANNAKTFSENYTNITKSVSQSRLSVSGVDNDEEALNLVKFQEAYNLSAKVMQIMTEIYDRLINQTGV
ncbi:MAG: flagellar hook-associated protein FlgK [Lachnospiraceae bacterium]|nr:flagellar hook-associated protein FlgK [Lachnospiraceae bacterium]